ncbi:uncharacterized protein BO66DRAFT_439870 [Aspergillus aculeatinus CBS 121060]|uniref:Uncharacterized protein n=1 Tax=Aspergillus aculeatinus CBS 121060 TaxID=1448322 RepID=A0ACD1H5Y3_9EURO|nr:hypothetical protein BO66DRAFT_439870 [Aspergillus aculeatinus CBS 121060]RAH68860.1 hypothetical protein BO66DRAFT_439870 [Aspergillus aculeatinus CBS 121060]
MELLPTEIMDQILSFVVELFSPKPSYRMPCLSEGKPKHILTTSAAKCQLAALRLTGRVFYRSASVLLFQALTVGGHSPDSLERLERLSHSPQAACVRHLSFAFYHPELYTQSKPANLADDIRYLQQLQLGFNDCLSRFPGLREIVFSQPCCEPAPCDRDRYLDIVARTLRDVELPSLSEVHLHLEHAHSLRHILDAISSSSQPRTNDNLPRLRHLVLYTPGLNYDTIAQGSPSPEAATAAATQSHAARVLRLLGLAPNLETLTLTTWVMGLDTAVLPSLRLRALCLLGVEIPSKCLLRFLEALHNTLRSISFTHVCLRSGTWATVLTGMCSLPHLLQLNLECNGYSSSRAGFSLFHHMNGLVTTSPYDLPALGALYRHISRNRIAAGRQPLMATPTEHNFSIHQELLTCVKRVS